MQQQPPCTISMELKEEINLLSTISPNEYHLDRQSLIFGTMDGLELELDLPIDFSLGVPSLFLVAGAFTADMTALLSKMFLNFTNSHSSFVSNNGKWIYFFEFLLSASDLTAAEAAIWKVKNGLEMESMVGYREAALLCIRLPPSL